MLLAQHVKTWKRVVLERGAEQITASASPRFGGRILCSAADGQREFANGFLSRSWRLNFAFGGPNEVLLVWKTHGWKTQNMGRDILGISQIYSYSIIFLYFRQLFTRYSQTPMEIDASNRSIWLLETPGVSPGEVWCSRGQFRNNHPQS